MHSRAWFGVLFHSKEIWLYIPQDFFMINGLTCLPKVNVNCWEVCFRNTVLTRAKITKEGHPEKPSGPQCCGHFLDTEQLVERCMKANQTEIKQVEKGILPLKELIHLNKTIDPYLCSITDYLHPFFSTITISESHAWDL